MATSDEYTELINNCVWVLVEDNGVKGYKVIGPNGNSIFLPSTGNYYGSSFSDIIDYYWCSTPCSEHNEHARALSFYFEHIYMYNKGCWYCSYSKNRINSKQMFSYA